MYIWPLLAAHTLRTETNALLALQRSPHASFLRTCSERSVDLLLLGDDSLHGAQNSAPAACSAPRRGHRRFQREHNNEVGAVLEFQL